ncbi:MAG TPA: magnesium and cobalt transport protein CorA [Alcaligenaceae bacterium]|nr:magnesium and cobalt transport protein CorA [Alcaligenaceae bacterium]
MPVSTSKENRITYYVPGQAPQQLDQAYPRPEKVPGSVLWISLYDPSVAELEQLLPYYVQQQRAIDEIQSRHRRPKVVTYEGASLIVAMTFFSEQGVVRFGEVQLLFGDGFLISIWRNTRLNDHEVQEYLEESPELIARGADYISAEILDFITDDYTESLLEFERRVEKAETHLFVGRSQKKDIEQVYHLRRTLLRIQSSIGPLSELSRRFARQNETYIGDGSRAYFAEVADRIARQAELIGALRDTLAFAFEGGMMIIQLQQNDVTRKLAAWAAIIAIPTAFAGIYGMNFQNMPELSWNYGYPVVLSSMAVVCAGLYYRFKRMKWL